MTPAVDHAAVTVCAVVRDAAVLAEQRRHPDRVELVRADAIDRACARAVGTGATWIWLLDSAVAPSPGALEALLAALADARALGDPILLSSMVVTPGGELDAVAAPWPRLFWRENAILGAEHRLVALRAAPYGSLLVHRRAFDLHGPPRADFAGAGDDLEWTGRLLRETPAYLVPGSVAVRERSSAADAAALMRARVRILRGDGWAGTDRLWFAFLLLSDLASQLLARPAGALRLVGAMASGLRAAP
ncbi:MAG: hypothetical protein M3376_12040 [Actinomycetota bacterium]|nr:hypothetical protein [Actinomycetota bacterium]